MKRDMNLIRLLLLNCESEGSQADALRAYETTTQVYHLALLIEAGLIRGEVTCDEQGEPGCVITTGLTWAGHDFLDAARSEGPWRKAIAIAKEKGVTLTLDILQDLLKGIIRDQLGMR